MLEREVLKLLAANADIGNRISRGGNPPIGYRAYLGRVPEGVPIDGGTIVVKKIARRREYGLVYEEESKFTTLQVDCYDLLPEDADSLGDLVAGVISGEPAIGLVAGNHVIESSLIDGERTENEKPTGASDDWRPRDSRDYQIHHT